jgi:hypothetical protein
VLEPTTNSEPDFVSLFSLFSRQTLDASGHLTLNDNTWSPTPIPLTSHGGGGHVNDDEMLQLLLDLTTLDFIGKREQHELNILRQTLDAWCADGTDQDFQEFQEVVGDISLLRFLRGGREAVTGSTEFELEGSAAAATYNMDTVVSKAVELFQRHIHIREKYCLDKYRVQIYNTAREKWHATYSNPIASGGGGSSTSGSTSGSTSSSTSSSSSTGHSTGNSTEPMEHTEPTNEQLEEFLVTYQQTDCIYGDEIMRDFRGNYNAGLSPVGNPVAAYYINPEAMVTWTKSKSMFDKLTQHLCHAFVYRQIQVNILSRRQGRLAKVSGIFSTGSRGVTWRFLVPGTPRNFLMIWEDVCDSYPQMRTSNYILDNSYFLQTLNEVKKVSGVVDSSCC